MAWFKAHRLPYPSPGFAGSSTKGAGTMDLVWRKSPTGSASGFCSATIELWPKTDTATVTTVIVDGRETGAAITGIPTTAPTNYDVRMRRLNPYGYGSWTPTITVEVQ